MERQAITGTYVLHEHTFPCQTDRALFFYRRPVSQDDPDFFHRGGSNGPGEDFERAQQDRLGGGALVSVAYWIVRGVQLLFGAVVRVLRPRSRT
jgi:hypothetical protein